MLALSQIIDFLLELMRDDTARAEFQQDPEGSLARAGLQGITGQDVRDARLLLADSGAVSPADGSGRTAPAADADPVRQIDFTAQNFRAEPSPSADDDGPDPSPSGGPESGLAGNFFFQTFSSDDDVTIFNDSFNSIDAQNSFNQGSFNSQDTLVAIDAENSFNSQDSLTAIQDNDTVVQDNDVLIAGSPPAPAPATAAPAPADPDPAALDPAAPDPVQPEPVQPEPATPDPVEPAAEEAPAEEAPAEEPQAEEPPAEEPPAEEPADDDAADAESA